jgi:signal transduction histidine kinase
MKLKQVLFVLFLIYSTCSVLQAKDTLLIDPIIIDSIETLINNSKKNKEKVRLLNEYARLNFYNHEYKEGLIATAAAHKLSYEIDFPRGHIMFHTTVATFLGENDLKVYHLWQARDLSRQNNINDLKTTPIFPTGYSSPSNEELIKNLPFVLSHFEKSGNKDIQAIIISQLSVSNFIQGNFEEAQSLNGKVIKLYSDLNQLCPLLMHHNFRLRLVIMGHVEGDEEHLENEFNEVLNGITDQNKLKPLYHLLGEFHKNLGQVGIAINYFSKSVEYFKSSDDIVMLIEAYKEISFLYLGLEMFVKQAETIEQIKILREKLNLPFSFRFYANAMWTMYGAKRYDNAREYMNYILQNADPQNKQTNMPQNIEYFEAVKNDLEGQILMDHNKYKEAIPYLEKAFPVFINYETKATIPWEAMHLANCYYQIGDLLKALKYGQIALENQKFNQRSNVRLERKIELILYNVYNSLGREALAFRHLQRHHDLVEKTKLKDQANLLMRAEVSSVLEKSKLEIAKLEQEQILKEQQNKTQRLWIFSITGALLSALLVSLILYRNNKSKQKTNEKLSRQKDEIQSAHQNLKATQAQLIQSEKMASLGEMTAGIAHEIQNPLNFVNNFSDINSELVEELKEEIEKGNLDEVKALATDIAENEQKIIHHGKRADSIVKSMLQHSSTGSGEKIPTDINAMAEEYMNLAYHGMRAKEKMFNTKMETNFDPGIGKVRVIPQEIGRVFLNLFNNAFQAVQKKARGSGKEYNPNVSLKTEIIPPLGGGQGVEQIQIAISDNGNGIPKEALGKIFQPFFTTKPTGEGTGLGLSMSYDIVKAHGGEIRVETEEGKGTKMIVSLPLNE